MSIRSAPVAGTPRPPGGPTRFEQVLACGQAWPRTVLAPWARVYEEKAARRKDAKQKRAKNLEKNQRAVQVDDVRREEDRILAQDAADLEEARAELRELQEDRARVEAEALSTEDGSLESQRLVDQLNDMDAEIRDLQAEIAAGERNPSTVREFRDGPPSLQLTNNPGGA